MAMTTTYAYPATHPGCLAGLEVTLADVTDPTDRYAPPTVTACPPPEQRDGLNLAMHQRGYCKCGRAEG